MGNYALFALFTIAVFIIKCSKCEDNLKFVSVFFRHGARTPLASLHEFEKEISWDYGYGELTPSGHRQLHLFGYMLRKYYIEGLNLLSRNYNESEIYARSTDYHRTIMSTRSVLLGLYPDTLPKISETQLKDENNWMPPIKLTIADSVKYGTNNSGLPYDIPVIPVQNYIWNQDRLLKMPSCKLYMAYRSQYYYSEKFVNTCNKYNSSFQEGCKLFDVDCSKVNHFDTFNYVDYMISAEYDGKAEILTKRQELLSQLNKFYTDMLLEEVTFKPIMSNIVLHEFSNVMNQYFTDILEHKNIVKLALFGTHDDNILAYLYALGIPREKYEIIKYASHIIFEVWKKDQIEEYYVNIIYNGEKIFEKLELKEFIKNLNNKGNIGDSWENICNKKADLFNEIQQESNNFAIYFSLLGIIIAIVFFMVNIKKYCQKTEATNNLRKYNEIIDI